MERRGDMADEEAAPARCSTHLPERTICPPSRSASLAQNSSLRRTSGPSTATHASGLSVRLERGGGDEYSC